MRITKKGGLPIEYIVLIIIMLAVVIFAIFFTSSIREAIIEKITTFIEVFL